MTKRLLLIEDDADSRELLQHVLESTDIELTTADSLEEVKKSLKNSLPDLILTDLSIPGVAPNGEIVDAIREACHGENVPIVLLSGHSSLSEVAKHYQVGFISKPFSIDTLLKTVG